MNRVLPQTMIVASLLLALGHAAHGGPPNPTESDSNGNTAGGTGALYSITPASQYNTASGTNALRNNTTGNSNTASGSGQSH